MPAYQKIFFSNLYEISNGNAIKLGCRSVNCYDAEEMVWRYMFDGPFNNAEELSISLQSQIDSPNGLCMCVFDIASGLQIGIANFMNNTPCHLKIELGGIW